MEKSTKLGEEDGTENVTLREGKTVMEEPQKKKKLVFFEVDSCNNGQDGYEVPNFKIKGKLKNCCTHHMCRSPEDFSLQL